MKTVEFMKVNGKTVARMDLEDTSTALFSNISTWVGLMNPSTTDMALTQTVFTATTTKPNKLAYFIIGHSKDNPILFINQLKYNLRSSK